MKLYLDNCCFNRPFDDQSQLRINLESIAKLEIQRLILINQHTLVWSYMLDYENAHNPYDLRREAIKKWRYLSCECIMENENILTFAESLAVKGIKTKDAIHIACAKEANCDYFLTTDKKLLNTPVDGVTISNPITFINETEV